ncbi:hypothetical protein [Nocardia beijingensis]
MLVEVNTGHAHPRDEGEDVGWLEDSAQGADRRTDSAGKRYRLGVVEQIECRNVAARLDEQIPRPRPFPMGGPVRHHHQFICMDHRAHQWPDTVMFIADHAPPHADNRTAAATAGTRSAQDPVERRHGRHLGRRAESLSGRARDTQHHTRQRREQRQDEALLAPS